MTVYGGFAPGTYQTWALNLLTSVFLSPGIARALQVIPNTPNGMSVLVTVDPTAGDGLCYLPNGSWLRIDAQATLNVPSNTSGSTRTDAVVAQVDPTGATLPSLSYVTNWTLGMTGGATDQLVLALVSVPNNAVSIVSGDITQTGQVANFSGAGNATSINNALFAVQNTANNSVTVFPAQPGNTAEVFVVQVWNGSALVNVLGIGGNGGSQLSYFSQGGDLLLGSAFPKVFGGNGSYVQYGSNTDGNLTLNPGTGYQVNVKGKSGSTYFDLLGNFQGNSGGWSTTLLNSATTTGQRWFITGTQPTNATVGDVWVRTDTTLS